MAQVILTSEVLPSSREEVLDDMTDLVTIYYKGLLLHWVDEILLKSEFEDIPLSEQLRYLFVMRLVGMEEKIRSAAHLEKVFRPALIELMVRMRLREGIAFWVGDIDGGMPVSKRAREWNVPRGDRVTIVATVKDIQAVVGIACKELQNPTADAKRERSTETSGFPDYHRTLNWGALTQLRERANQIVSEDGKYSGCASIPDEIVAEVWRRYSNVTAGFQALEEYLAVGRKLYVPVVNSERMPTGKFVEWQAGMPKFIYS